MRISSLSIWVLSLQHISVSLTPFWSFAFSPIPASGISTNYVENSYVFPSAIIQRSPLRFTCCVSYISYLFPFLIYIGKYSITPGMTSFNVRFCSREGIYNALVLSLAGFPLHWSLSPANQSTLFLCLASHSRNLTTKEPPAPEFELNLSWSFAFWFIDAQCMWVTDLLDMSW